LWTTLQEFFEVQRRLVMYSAARSFTPLPVSLRVRAGMALRQSDCRRCAWWLAVVAARTAAVASAEVRLAAALVAGRLAETAEVDRY
jgi:hypothetical protein